MKFLIKYHKWISIVFAVFILIFAISGIVLNHRKLFSSIDVSRRILPAEYEYNNWNNTSVKGTLKLNNDSVLIYGNIGIWLTDSSMQKFSDFNAGFKKGSDNHKICKLFKTQNNQLLAGTFFGLFRYNYSKKQWQYIEIPEKNSRITDILEVNTDILIQTRSALYRTNDLITFNKIQIPEPENYNNKIGLFKTLWVIHSGEIYGNIGKIIVDIVGLIFAFLTITGLIVFFNKIVLKKQNTTQNKRIKLIKSNLWNLKWHNKIGWTSLILLIITTSTGIFLRPPFLIPIANIQVKKIPFSELDTPNPWFDKLRRIIYDEQNKTYILATLDGVFYTSDHFKTKLKKFETQPPMSVMGVNVFEKTDLNSYLIGSFEGLFLWNTKENLITNYITKEKYINVEKRGAPIGQFIITGIARDTANQIIYFDYNNGASYIESNKIFTKMPQNIANQPISLWNLALEIHTGRIFQFIIGDFYILVVPIVGLAILFILISGFIVWYKKYKIKKNENF
jgi:hypothetical protein